MVAPSPTLEKKARAEAEALSPNVELGRLSRSITPSLSRFIPLFPHEHRKEALKGTGYPDYCHFNEDGCWDSPDCCANGSCYVPATLWSAAPSTCALGSTWVGVLAVGVGFAGLI